MHRGDISHSKRRIGGVIVLQPFKRYTQNYQKPNNLVKPLDTLLANRREPEMVRSKERKKERKKESTTGTINSDRGKTGSFPKSIRKGKKD